jgi:CheY-like chemotaxis protein
MGTVMVVDDNFDLCKMLGKLLGRAGHHGVCASSAADAIEQVHKNVPDLMILDLMMPDENGLSVLRKMKADPRTSAMPVVIYSAVSEPRYVQEALDAGAEDYWVKGTFDAGQWETRLKAFLPDGLNGWSEPLQRGLHG